MDRGTRRERERHLQAVPDRWPTFAETELVRDAMVEAAFHVHGEAAARRLADYNAGELTLDAPTAASLRSLMKDARAPAGSPESRRIEAGLEVLDRHFPPAKYVRGLPR